MNIIPKDRILILDGAMGTMIQKYAPTQDGNNDELNLTAPAVIFDIHQEYIDAGAGIISTNTFSANRISQHEYGLSDKAREMALAGAKIAREAADKNSTASHRIYVAGSVGPTSKSLTLASDASDPSFRQYSFDQLSEAYQEQIQALVEGGVDFILLETCFDALNVKAAIYAMTRIFPEMDFPLMISVSVADKSGRTLTGQTLEAFYTSVKHYPLLSFGLNCSLGASGMTGLMEEVARFADCAVSCYPNAGLPNELGNYDETPEQMASDMRIMASKGILNIAGGCCGTTPEHIRAIAEKLEGVSPRPPICEDVQVGGSQKKIGASDASVTEATTLTVSGLEAYRIESGANMFVPVGERTNVAGSRKFARLIAEKNYSEAMEVAANQIDKGANIIDVNMDDAMLDSTKEMTVFTRHISSEPSVAKAALMIDSSHWETIVAGLKNVQGKSIVNSISLKDGEETFIERARQIHALGAAMVVMAFDEEGQATDYQRKIQICSRAYKLLTEKAGVPPQDIIFDVNVLTVATGLSEHSKYAVHFIEAVRWIKANLPGALTSGGISNLSFAFRGNNSVREAMHSVFLYHAIRAGLDMAIVNAGVLPVYDDIDARLREAIEDVIFDRRQDATENLLAIAAEIAEAKANSNISQTVVSSSEDNSTPESRVKQCLIKGRSTGLESDLMALLESFGSAVKVIEGPLMSAMETVGEWFGEGKMFLPQVVKSAMVMKEAVAVLQPYMDADAQGGSSVRPKIVIATVKGDVHDIGKNITAIVLRCNGFDVTDLGVMVETETILDKAEEIGADIICVSGLITPSLFRMEEICREMTARGMNIPLFVGGATTSDLHTAVKLAPLYDKVFHGSDASASAVMAKKYMADSEKFISAEHEKQEQIRNLHSGKKLGEKAPAPVFPPESFLKPEEISLFGAELPAFRPEDLMPYFDWKLFLIICGIKDENSEHAQELRREAESEIRELEGQIKIAVAVKLFEAWAEGNVISMEDAGRQISLPMLRQEEAVTLSDGTKACVSLADFLPQRTSGLKSVCGMFSISVALEGGTGHCHCCGNSEELVVQAILDCFAEAASASLAAKIQDSIKREDVKVLMPAVGYACCPDHSLKADILSRLSLDADTGIRLTESYGMSPDASICGLVFMHPQAFYPDIRHIGQEQFDNYLKERKMTSEEGGVLLGHIL